MVHQRQALHTCFTSWSTAAHQSACMRRAAAHRRRCVLGSAFLLWHSNVARCAHQATCAQRAAAHHHRRLLLRTFPLWRAHVATGSRQRMQRRRLQLAIRSWAAAAHAKAKAVGSRRHARLKMRKRGAYSEVRGNCCLRLVDCETQARVFVPTLCSGNPL